MIFQIGTDKEASAEIDEVEHKFGRLRDFDEKFAAIYEAARQQHITDRHFAIIFFLLCHTPPEKGESREETNDRIN